MKAGRNLTHLKGVAAWSQQGQLACDWPKLTWLPMFGGTLGGVVASAHAMHLNLAIDAIIVCTYCDISDKICSFYLYLVQ